MAQTELLTTDVRCAGTISLVESTRICESLDRNGIAVIRGLLSQVDLERLQNDAEVSVNPDFDFGLSLGAKLSPTFTPATAEFFFPFFVSPAAVEVVTTPSLLAIVERYLGDRAIVHHGLFQESYPVPQPAVDWHVDTGSNKALNGAVRLPDKRLRMIVYLTSVSNGGLSYILDSREAAAMFLGMADDAKFPAENVPDSPERRVTINQPAGTVILFDAHGLHRPEAPRDRRLVLNTWFARSDFSAAIPPALISLSNFPPDRMDQAYIFKNARGFMPANLTKRNSKRSGGVGMVRRGLRSLLGR